MLVSLYVQAAAIADALFLIGLPISLPEPNCHVAAGAIRGPLVLQPARK